VIGNNIKIKSRIGSEFDCYLAMPGGREKSPAVVLVPAIHGIDEDIRGIADEFAEAGFIAAGPDVFWRTLPGPLLRGDARTKPRGLPRKEKIKTGEADMLDTLAELRKLPQFNGRAAIMGFCYGAPYALIGPNRLGYAAGISCHGTALDEYIQELEGVTSPICVIWGDKDHQAPPATLEMYRALPPRMSNVEVHVLPGIEHSYMMPLAVEAFDKAARKFSMDRALDILNSLR
jgi:carboxymethylenebutenolidase